MDTASPGLRLRVSTARDGGEPDTGPIFRIRRGDGHAAAKDEHGHTPASARIVAARLEHIAQWTHLHELVNPGSTLAGAVSLELATAEPGQSTDPLQGSVLTPDANGAIRLSYRRGPSGWTKPTIFVRLRNTSGKRLWCALLNLTERYRVHASLLPGTWINPGLVASACEGRPIPVGFPREVEARPGAAVKDWLKLLVSDEQFTTTAFELPSLDAPDQRGRGSMLTAGLIDRLGARVRTREMGDEPGPGQVADWTTSIVRW